MIINNILEYILKINAYNFIFTDLYNYLDTLTVYQEAALLHFFFFLMIIHNLLNISAALFGNEIIKYFKLEEKFPRLASFFKLRAKLQKYYLMGLVIYMFILCLGGIWSNFMLFIYW